MKIFMLSLHRCICHEAQ